MSRLKLLFCLLGLTILFWIFGWYTNFYSSSLSYSNIDIPSRVSSETELIVPPDDTTQLGEARPSNERVEEKIVKDTKLVVEEKKVAVKIENKAPEVPPPVASSEFPFNSLWRDDVVNLFCANAGSGSGVLIDPRGVILTNAHVGTMFIFADWPSQDFYNCTVRVGSPASPLYRAQLLYIPDAYMQEVFDEYYQVPDEVEKNFVGGRKDYALLVITARTNPEAKLPEVFPYMKVSNEQALPKGSFAYLVGYPATFLGGVTMLRDLYMLNSPVRVDAVKGIGTGPAGDVISFKGSIAGQHGSSGGAVVNSKGELAGMITFFDDGRFQTTDANVLNAITPSYVDRDIKVDTGMSLAEFIGRENLMKISDKFMAQEGARYQRRYADMWYKNEDYVIPGVTY